MTILDLLTVAVLAVVGVRLFEAARTSVGAHRKTLGVVQGLRWRHEGNPVVGVSDRDLGIASVVIPLFFIGLLIVGMPLLVAREEWVFRRGAEERGTAVNLGRSLVFGLAHAVVGIPIGAALALSIGGLYLTRCYLNGWKETRSQTGALLESTRAHLAYNLTIVALVLLSLLVLVATGTA